MKIKNYLFPFFMFISTVLIGQEDINVEEILTLQERPNSRYEYCIQTIFNKLNNSSIYLQDFLDKEIGLSTVGEPDYNLDKGVGTIKTTYTKSIIMGHGNIDYDAYKIYVEYKVFPIENDFFVEKLDIWGNWEIVANIFISYYPTTLNIEHLKNNKSEITSYYIGDRAVFSSYFDKGKLKARIKVRSTSEKDYEEFMKEYELKKQKHIEKKKQEQYEARQKLQKFLQEREKNIYSLEKINQKEFNNTLSEITDYLNESSSYSNDIRSDFNIIINFDTTGQKNIDIRYNNSSEIPTSIVRKIENIKIEPPKLNSYYVKTSDTTSYELNYSSEIIYVVKRDDKVKFKGDYSEKSRTLIKNYLSTKNSGRYSLKLKKVDLNDSHDSKIQEISYKETIDYKKYLYYGALVVGGVIYYFVQ